VHEELVGCGSHQRVLTAAFSEAAFARNWGVVLAGQRCDIADRQAAAYW